MKQRKYFDCFALLGRPNIPDKDYPYDVETLKSDMAYSRVHAAATIQNACIDYSYSYGNRLGLEIAKQNAKNAGVYDKIRFSVFFSLLKFALLQSPPLCVKIIYV